MVCADVVGAHQIHYKITNRQRLFLAVFRKYTNVTTPLPRARSNGRLIVNKRGKEGLENELPVLWLVTPFLRLVELLYDLSNEPV